MAPRIRLKFQNGELVSLDPLPALQEGDTLEFLLPDPDIVYLCENDKLAALENGKIVWTPADDEGADS